MTDMQRIYTGAVWEQRYGYCRALRAGNQIVTTGTVALESDGSPHAPGDAGAQTSRCYETIEHALGQLDATKQDIIRCRIYTTDISAGDAIGSAHQAFFDGHHPCLTMVGISELIDPAFIVEIEVEALATP